MINKQPSTRGTPATTPNKPSFASLLFECQAEGEASWQLDFESIFDDTTFNFRLEQARAVVYAWVLADDGTNIRPVRLFCGVFVTSLLQH